MKHCSKCNEDKGLDKFSTDNKRKDGKFPYCKQCESARLKAYQPTISKERIVAKNAKQRAYYAIEENRLRKLESIRRRRNTPEGKAKRREESRLYNLNNRPAKTAHTIAYRGRKRAAIGTATPAQIQARVDYYGGKCWLCSEPYREIDHVKPLSKGGWGWPANLRPICRSCNASKGSKWSNLTNVAPVSILPL